MRDIRKLNPVPVVIMLPCGPPFSFSPFNPQTKETNKKQNKKKQALPLILPSTKKKRVAVALAASSSPLLLAGVPSAWCIQRPRQ
jgi:hypothetical protein